MINIKSFAKAKKGTSTSDSSTGFSNTTTLVKKNLDTHYIYGNPFDGTQDVSGEINNVTNINASGTVTAEQVAATTGNITTVNSTNGNITNVNATTTNTTNLTATSAEIDDLIATLFEAEDAVIGDLTVKKAHFWELIIDKMKSTEGAFILSPANAKIEKKQGNYLMWRIKDPYTGEARMNDFAVGDQVICMSFNKATEVQVATYDVDNKYYWSVVTAIGQNMAYDPITSEYVEWHYITLSDVDYDGTLDISEGDELVVLGNRNDSTRQNAIIMSATNSNFLDETITAPSIVQYKGIHTFELARYRLNCIGASGNTFYGNFMVVNGNNYTDVQDLINDSKANIASIVTDSQMSFIITDENNQYDSISAGVGLVQSVSFYLGSTLIETNELDSTSYVKYRGHTHYINNNTQPRVPYVTGIVFDQFTDVDTELQISYKYVGVDMQGNPVASVTAQDEEFECYVKFTRDGVTYEKTLKVPCKVIATQAGDDAEFDMMFVNNFNAIVTLQDKLTINSTVDVYHCVGQSVTKVTNLNVYTLTATSNAGDSITFTKSNGSFTYSNNNYRTDYSQQQTLQTSYTLTLTKSGNIQDRQSFPVVFNAGSIFQVKEDAITLAVQGSEAYTNQQITSINNTISNLTVAVTGITSRVATIEGDYTTSTDLQGVQDDIDALSGDLHSNYATHTTIQSEIAQSATGVAMSVTTQIGNELQRTGIDIQQYQININSDNTNFNGNINLYNPNEGLILYNQDNTPSVAILNADVTENDGSWDYFSDSSTNQLNDDTVTYTYNNISLGVYNVGDTITVMNLVSKLLIGMENITTQLLVSGFTYTAQFLKGSTVKQTITATGEVRDGYCTSTSVIEYDVEEIGKYYFNISLTFDLTQVVTATVINQTNFSYNGFTLNNNIQLVGIDGVLFKAGQNLIKLNEDGIVLQHKVQNNHDKPSMLQVTSDTILRYVDGGTFGEMSTTHPYKTITQDYTVTLNDALIYASVDDIHITLPYASNEYYGKSYYIVGNERIYVDCTSGITMEYYDRYNNRIQQDTKTSWHISSKHIYHIVCVPVLGWVNVGLTYIPSHSA